jgi:hypothetical protein
MVASTLFLGHTATSSAVSINSNSQYQKQQQQQHAIHILFLEPDKNDPWLNRLTSEIGKRFVFFFFFSFLLCHWFTLDFYIANLKTQGPWKGILSCRNMYSQFSWRLTAAAAKGVSKFFYL